jgi:hypothetical protein
VLKDCLLRRFDKTEDDFKQKFRACRPESGETFQKFAVRLSGFFNRWIFLSFLGDPLKFGLVNDTTFALRASLNRSANWDISPISLGTRSFKKYRYKLSFTRQTRE